MTCYIDTYRDRFGVEPICRALQVAPSSYYTARCRPLSARASSDAELAPKILKVFNDNYQVYGARKLWKQLRREGELVGRDRVARLMRTLGIAGTVRGKPRRTTIPDPAAARAPDLVNRQFTATRPSQLWVSDFERHEVLLNRAVVKGTPPGARRSEPLKLRAARRRGRG